MRPTQLLRPTQLPGRLELSTRATTVVADRLRSLTG